MREIMRGRVLRRDCLILRGESDKVAILCLAVHFAKVLFKVLVKTEVLKINQVKHGDPSTLAMRHLTPRDLVPSMDTVKQSNRPRSS